jgi:hypothetical protein
LFLLKFVDIEIQSLADSTVMELHELHLHGCVAAAKPSPEVANSMRPELSSPDAVSVTCEPEGEFLIPEGSDPLSLLQVCGRSPAIAIFFH